MRSPGECLISVVAGSQAWRGARGSGLTHVNLAAESDRNLAGFGGNTLMLVKRADTVAMQRVPDSSAVHR